MRGREGTRSPCDPVLGGPADRGEDEAATSTPLWRSAGAVSSSWADTCFLSTRILHSLPRDMGWEHTRHGLPLPRAAPYLSLVNVNRTLRTRSCPRARLICPYTQ